MSRLSIKEILIKQTQISDIIIYGWVRTRRDNKNFVFLEINDGSCLENIQCIVDEGTSAFLALTNVNTGASLKIKGNLIASIGKGQNFEIQVSELEVLGLADSTTFPLQKKRHSDEFLRTIAHLRPRTNKYSSIFRLRSEVSFAVHNYFRELGFFYVHTPIITGADCEGAGEMFRVSSLNIDQYKNNSEDLFSEDFFGKEAKLTVSGQLEAEALAMGLGKVYTFGPTFRAENSNTARHAAEFWMIEPEAAFMDLTENMKLSEGLISYVTKHIMENCQDELNLFNKFIEPNLLESLNTVINKGFERISYRDAVNLIKQSNKKFEYSVDFGSDLQTEHERFLAEEYFKSPVTVYDYPKNIKAFYMRMNDDNETVAAMDLLVPRIGELIGGSQREERLDMLTKRILELGQNPKDFWWYLDLRRFGSVPHSGFGLGFERLIMMLTGVSNIRDVIPFPRTVGSLEF